MYSDIQYADHVRELQHYLRTLSLTDDRYPLIAVDGIFGKETTNAVRVFREINGFPPAGEVDRAVWERLLHEYQNTLLLVTNALPLAAFPFPSFVLNEGDRLPFVYILQVLLNDVSAKLGDYPPLPISGVYDKATVERVITLKRLAEYPPTPTLDRLFWDYLAVWYNGSDVV